VSYVKSETLDSCRFETKNAPVCTKSYLNFHFPGVTPDPRHWGLCPRPPGGVGGVGREGRKGKGQGKGKGRGGKGE